MKCYNHLRIDAVAPCEDCGKGLCKTCADKYSNTVICDSCNLKRIKDIKNEQISELTTLAFTFVLSAVAMYYLQFDSNFKLLNSVVSGLIFVCIVAGWRTLSALTPRFFLILPLIGFLIYIGVKLALSTAIGLIAAPYRITKSILTLIKIAKTVKRIKALQENSHPHPSKVSSQGRTSLLQRV